MVLLDRADFQTRDLIVASGLEFDELDSRAQRAKIDRKTGMRLLTLQRLAHRLVASVNSNDVAGNEGRGEKREPHDVVPVGMRQKDVESIRPPRPVLRDH